MEVKITISDSGSPAARVEMPAATTAAAPVSAEVTDAGQAGAGGGGAMSAPSDISLGAPADLLMRAAEMGAINAGPAPDFSMAQQGAPPPFITGQATQMGALPGAVGAAVPESAGAAPGAEARMVTHTAPEGGGGQS